MGVRPEEGGSYAIPEDAILMLSRELIPWSFLGVRPLLPWSQKQLLGTLERDQGETQGLQRRMCGQS